MTGAETCGHGTGVNPKPYSWPLKATLVIEALVALAYARAILHRTRPDNVLARNRAAQQIVSRKGPDPDQSSAQIAFVVPRLARRLPWRADCLVQALAGQVMLSRRGLASEILVGTAKHPDGTFEAHAWLTCGGLVVLGGDVVRFVPLLDSRDDPAGSP